MKVGKSMSWSDISERDFFYAYRKAKADAYYERSLVAAGAFVEFESSLPNELLELRRNVLRQGLVKVLAELPGRVVARGKRLGLRPKRKSRDQDSQSYFSDPHRAFSELAKSNTVTPELRLIGEFPVEIHVLAALWINLVGHKFDCVLSDAVFGSRLRRVRRGTPRRGERGRYHLEAVGSFEPYYKPYRQWRSRGLDAIRNQLAVGGKTVAVTMDLASYYHGIDPRFAVGASFLRYAGIQLTEWELEFTRSFVDYLCGWSNQVCERLEAIDSKIDSSRLGGLPIGLSISRVLSNCLLVGLDREIERELHPLYYGRYVDDLFIVLRDTGEITRGDSLLRYFSSRSRVFRRGRSKGKSPEWTLDLPDQYQEGSKLILKDAKQKVFFLSGRAGVDLLDTIEKQMRDVASERRLMPLPEGLASMASARVLSTAARGPEEADSLRQADGLSVRRLGWSVQVKAVETLAAMLEVDDWSEGRQRFYEFARNHVLGPERILDYLDHLPRLISIAVDLEDWTDARKLYETAQASLSVLRSELGDQRCKVNGKDVDAGCSELWDEVGLGVRKSAAEAVIRAIPWNRDCGGPRRLGAVALRFCGDLGIEGGEQDIQALSRDFREADWGKVAYKEHLRHEATAQRARVEGEEKLSGLYRFDEDLHQFLRKSAVPTSLAVARVNQRCFSAPTPASQEISMIPYLFPIRPYSPREIALFLPEDCVFASSRAEQVERAREWARFVSAVRGVFADAEVVASDESPSVRLEGKEVRFALQERREAGPVRLGISSLETSDATWRRAALGNPDLSVERYRRIVTIVNQALEARPRPTHLLLPELALPEQWLGTVVGLLEAEGISLVTGLDYVHHSDGKSVHSEAAVVLIDKRLGYSTAVEIRQQKTVPAPHEEQVLLRDFGKTWAPGLSEKKPIYLHGDIVFGVLVCSELQNVRYRKDFQGEVDCTLVLSWNQDLETFATLVEAASLDMHCYVALVNNRRFGDSRVRVPAKKQFERDRCRLRGGENDHLVVVGLEADSLRRFQSRAKRWPSETDPFKPVPEGFEISPRRKSIPE